MLNYEGKSGNGLHYSCFVMLSPAVMVTAIMLVAKSCCRRRANVAEGLSSRRRV